MTLITALDAEPSAFDEDERNFVSLIREHGWFNTRVFEGEAGEPGFSYTTGFLLKGSPEFIIFGLKAENAHALFWSLYRKIGSTNLKTGERHDDVANFSHYLFDVADRNQSEYLGWSRWFYGKAIVPTLQFVWPDRAGVFPWEAGFDEKFRDNQPDLSDQGWANELAA